MPSSLDSTWAVRIALGTVSVALIAAGLGLRASGNGAAGAVSATVSVDFGKPIASVEATDIGAAISGYGNGVNVAVSAAHQEKLRTLGLKLLRIELRYSQPGNPASGVVCNSLGCDKSVTGAAWVKGIRAVGAEPLLVLPLDPGHPLDVDVKDAVNLAKFLKDQGAEPTWFVVGNEPDLGGNQKEMDPDEYVKRFVAIADALHAADPGYRVGGPGLAVASDGWVRTFLQGAGGKVDFVDFHHYGDCGSTRRPDGDVLTDGVAVYRSEIERIRKRIAELVPSRAGKVPIEIGEYNLECDRKQPRSYDQVTTVWGAAVLGTILASDARAVQFSDLNVGLGLISEDGSGGIAKGSPQPIYHSIGMFTGEGKFRGIGSTMVRATSSNAALDVFASTSGKDVVVVNTSTDPVRVDLKLTGLGRGETGADLWQTTKDEKVPHTVGTLELKVGGGSVAIPGRSVTTLVIGPDTPPPPGSSTTTAPPVTTTTTPATTTTPPTTSTPSTTAPPPGAGSGLRAEYFDNADLTGKSHSRTEPRVYLDYEHAPFPDFGPDEWSVRWTGRVRVDKAGEHTFTVTSDDGARLWVDGKQLVNDWTDHTIRDVSAKVTLTAGWHDLRLEYYDRADIAFCKLSWQTPAVAREVIPTEALTLRPDPHPPAP